MDRWIKIIFCLLLALSLMIACGDDDDDNDDNDATDDDDDSASPDDDTSDDDTTDDDTLDDDDDTLDDDTVDDDSDPGDAIEPTAGYLSRKAEYLQHCIDNNTPENSGWNGQVCLLVNDSTEFNEGRIDDSCEKINNREDCADFNMNTMLRLLYLQQDHPNFSAETLEQMRQAVLNFKYWLDEPGEDGMCWWSENHQILFHTAELLAGQLYQGETFPNSGMSGQDHIDHATPKILRWLNFRGMFGFSEWHSNVYFNEDLPPLINLVDFAENEEIRIKASMVLDFMIFEFANNYYKGLFAVPHGRTYESKILEGLNDSITEAVWVMTGLGEYSDRDNFSAVHLVTSSYAPPAVLEEIAADAEQATVHKQRDSIDLADGPDYGIGYEDWDDIMFWWGMTGYAAPEVAGGTLLMVDEFDMWGGFLWEDIQFLRIFVGSPLVPFLTGLIPEMAAGPALQSMSTYTYRTPHYQLSGAQDYISGMWMAQTMMWQATIDEDAFVYTSYPGGFNDDSMAGPWTGGWSPRATFHENVGVIQYERVSIPILEEFLLVDYTHAYFPRYEFDEAYQSGHWLFGRKGEGYVGLWSENETTFAVDPPEDAYEAIADGRANVWIVELGDSEHGTFADFMTDLENATITVGDQVTFASPSQGTVVVGMTGPMTVDGVEVDLGPYKRFDNDYAQQEFGTNRTIIEFNGHRLDLNFETGQRRYWDEF
ncbi:MAG TPA: hypothetical protein PKW95_07745 [bacterium]|nr:hypothetical protein [bacterium]